MRILFIAFLACALLSWDLSNQSITEVVTDRVVHNCDELLIAFHDFKTTSNKKNFQRLRVAFKRVEKYTAYFYASLEKEINGAPVFGLIKDGIVADKITPHGLQVIEEALAAGDQVLLAKEIKLLELRLKQVKEKLSNCIFTERAILEANRFAVLRIATLGITGYENVQFSDPIQESKVSLREIDHDLSLFKGAKTIEKKIVFSLSALSSSNFEELDRMELLKKGLDPLYQHILELHNNLGYEKISDGSALFPVNYDAKSIFSEDFLNAGYYTRFRTNHQSDTAEIRLGKLLFFDPILSSNNERSCASCHRPELGFTDGQAKSIAFNHEGTVDRNSPTLLNSAYQSNYFHDMSANHLEDQIHHVVQSKKEFNTNFSEIILKIRTSDDYRGLFNKAFGNHGEQINITNLKIALASYVRSLSSFNSEFDQYMRNEISEIAPEIKQGFNLFTGKANCGTCHFVPVFNGTVPPFFYDTDGEVLGAYDETKKALDSDIGRQGIVLNQYRYDFLKNMFKTPTLRNVKLTAPYMHNGAFEDLEEVMDFYNKGGGAGLGFDLSNQTLSDEKLGLTEQEIKAIIAFMNSLTDNPFQDIPTKLPSFMDEKIDRRKVGGVY